ncbi:MAG: hypothetical protein PWP22_1615, partial [Thermoanaerobacter sp.]|nr:hypothetical protein [Thermoanaerobacter sp.]
MNEKICPNCLEIYDTAELFCPKCNESLENYFEYFQVLESKLKQELKNKPLSKKELKRTLEYYRSLRNDIKQLSNKQFVIRTFQRLIDKIEKAIY